MPDIQDMCSLKAQYLVLIPKLPSPSLLDVSSALPYHILQQSSFPTLDRSRPVPGDVQGQGGEGLEYPGLEEGVPALDNLQGPSPLNL